MVLVAVVELDCDHGLRHAGLTVLVDQFTQIVDSDQIHVRNAKHKAYRIENVGLAWLTEKEFEVRKLTRKNKMKINCTCLIRSNRLYC